MNQKALAAEFVGTFALIFIGAGAGAIGAGGLVGVALAHGLVLVGIAAAYGPISGAYINPAVTLAMWVGRQIRAAEAVAYVLVQLLGGVAGAYALSYVLGGSSGSLGATTPASGVSATQAVVIEAVLTFFLVNTIFNTTVSGKGGNLAPAAIGLTLAFCILMGGPLTGASLNPARTIGPAVVSGNYSDFWVYLVGPALGGAAAALLYDRVFKAD